MTSARVIPPACGHGHALDKANTYIWPKNGKWQCRKCIHDRHLRHRAKVLAVRRAETAARLAARAVWPPENLAWAAGLFEGEGTATLLNGGRKNYVRSMIQLTSTDREVLEPFMRMWGGRTRSVGFKSANAREAWTWIAEGERMMAFLLDVGPHLRTTRVKAKFDLLLAVQDERRPGSRDPDYTERMQAHRVVMRALNRRGRHHDEPRGSGTSEGISPAA